MAVSTHVYAAYLVGSPDIALKVRGGSINLGGGRAPHVSAILSIAVPSLSTLTALDPRLTKRVRIDVTATVAGLSQSRSFNLSLRDRDMRHSDGTVSLTLASDESLIEDYAPLTDDGTPRTHQASLRAVINYVLNKAITGATLAAAPTHDANVTAYWSVTNLVTNSSFETDVAGWTDGSLATGFAPITIGSVSGTKSGHWQTTGVGWSFVDYSATKVTEGRTYVMSAYVAHITGGANRPGRIMIRWWDDRGTALRDDYSGSLTVTGSWTRFTMYRTAPEGATNATLHIGFDSDTAGRFVAVDAVMFYQGNEYIPYFDGSTADDANYTYTYSDETLMKGTSTRNPIVERLPESLIWKAGQSALDFLHPLVQAAGYRLVCDEARVWTLRDENYVAAGSLSIRHAINLIDGSDGISRDSGFWFDAALVTYTWTDANGRTQMRTDGYALTTPHTRLRLFERTTPYPGPGLAEYRVRRAQGLGREVSATAVSNWTARAEQPLTIVLSGAPTQIGASISVRFNLDNDTMTVTTRTTDTPLGAIDLLSGTINGLSGTINSL